MVILVVLILHEIADKIIGKMGEGTFGRVLECWDRDEQELVAIKVVRSAEKYREDAMIEIDVLSTLHKNDGVSVCLSFLSYGSGSFCLESHDFC